MNSSTEFDSRFARTFARHYPLLLGFVALLPFVVYRTTLAKLLWFGDDWDLVGQIDRVGLWTWIAKPWVESYSPLFKLVWGGSVFVFRGSYLAMLGLVWIGHAVTMILFGYLLRVVGFGWIAVSTTIAVIALTATNIETLCWSVQLSPLLANLFLVAAVLLYCRQPRSVSAGTQVGIILCITASALCYSRGVLTGVVLATMSLLPPHFGPDRTWPHRCLIAAGYLLPAVVVIGVILSVATGNQQAVVAGHLEKLSRMIEFGAWYFCLNPFYDLLQFTTWSPSLTWSLGAAKFTLVVFTLWHSRGLQRWLLVLLLVFDLGNAALLGLGRYHTGLRATASSRYQYCALLATIPFVAYWVDALFHLVPRARQIRQVVAASLLAWLIIAQVRGWSAPWVNAFVDWRGAQPRAMLFSGKPLPADYKVPGIPGLPPSVALELVKRYHLH
ncbi:MAG TPA: hypothetical protein VG710_03000 [Opitutus sp.]|nr:hypothetical protein [Opitutus sp.]